MDAYQKLRHKTINSIKELFISQELIDEILSYENKEFALKTNSLLNKYKKQLNLNRLETRKVLIRLSTIQKKLKLFEYKQSILSILKECTPQENDIIGEIEFASGKNEILRILLKQSDDVLSLLRNKKIEPFHKNKRNRKRLIKSNPKSASKRRKASIQKDKELKFKTYRSKVYQCLKKADAPQKSLNILLFLKSEKKIEDFVWDNLPHYIANLKKSKIKPFYKKIKPERIGNKKTIRLIYTPMGNKR